VGLAVVAAVLAKPEAQTDKAKAATVLPQALADHRLLMPVVVAAEMLERQIRPVAQVVVVKAREIHQIMPQTAAQILVEAAAVADQA
jgi:hypothetical protein